MRASVPQFASDGSALAVLPAEAFDGVRTRRILAYCADVIAILLINVALFVAALLLALPTLGLSLYLMAPTSVTVAVLYSALTISGAGRGTWGMRLAGLQATDTRGGRVTLPIAALHAIGFYVSVTFLTPLVLLIALFNGEKRLAHDFVLDVVVTRRSL